MTGKLPMGQKELLRGKLMEMVKQGNMTLKTAAGQLKISYRQGIRLYRAYRTGGDTGLLHGSRGKPSKRKTAEEIRSRVIKQYRLRYSDFGPTFAAEKLEEEEGVKISVSTLRRILMEEGLWQGKRRSREYRSRREPRPHFKKKLAIQRRINQRFFSRLKTVPVPGGAGPGAPRRRKS